MSDRSKRLGKLEGLIQEPTSKETTTFGERMKRHKKIGKVRQARRDKWLARATRGQLLIGLKRVDLLEEAWDRKVAEECAVAGSERRIQYAWASAPRFIMTRRYFHYRVAIVGRLLGGNSSREECREIIEGIEGCRGDVHSDSRAAINAGLILAAIETAATKELGRATPQGTA